MNMKGGTLSVIESFLVKIKASTISDVKVTYLILLILYALMNAACCGLRFSMACSILRDKVRNNYTLQGGITRKNSATL